VHKTHDTVIVVNQASKDGEFMLTLWQSNWQFRCIDIDSDALRKQGMLVDLGRTADNALCQPHDTTRQKINWTKGGEKT